MSETQSFHHVTTPESLSSLVAQLAGGPRVCIDTEADSLHHYFEKVCLIQLSVGQEHYIVDPLAGLDLGRLMDALARCPLILHGADYDLRMLARDFGFRASEVFDTMIAAQLLGYEKVSLAALVERYRGIVLDKHGQKADWSKRPLSPSLLEYAYNDTCHLEIVADAMVVDLREAGRLEWHGEMCRELMNSITDTGGRNHAEPDRAWRIKGWHSLKARRAQAILRELWSWRDDEAQRADLPPFRVMGNESLVQLAAWAHDSNDFAGMPRLPRNCVGRRMRALRAAIAKGRATPESEYPKPIPARKFPHVPEMDRIATALRDVRNEQAARMKMDPGILLPASSLNEIARARPTTPEALHAVGCLYEWQEKALGGSVIQAVRAVLSGAAPAAAPSAKEQPPSAKPDGTA